MSKLKNEVRDIIQAQGNEEEQFQFMKEVIQHGCVSGVVSELIYTVDSENWYSRNEKEIHQMIEELKEGTGLSEEELFENWTTLDEVIEHEFESKLDYDDFNTDEEYFEAQDEEFGNFVEDIDLYDFNKNLLAWFSFEEITQEILHECVG